MRKTLFNIVILSTWILISATSLWAQGGAPAFPDPSQPDFYQRYQAWVAAQESSDQDFFRNDFSSGSDDFFQEMETFRKEMIQRLQRNEQLLKRSKPEDVFSMQTGGAIEKIYREEKDGNLLIHIVIPGLEQGKYKVEVREEFLVISGELQQSHTSQGFQKFSFNHFQKSIPLPRGTDPNSVSYKTQKEKILVVIPQKQSTPPPVPPNLPNTQPSPLVI